MSIYNWGAAIDRRAEKRSEMSNSFTLLVRTGVLSSLWWQLGSLRSLWWLLCTRSAICRSSYPVILHPELALHTAPLLQCCAVLLTLTLWLSISIYWFFFLIISHHRQGAFNRKLFILYFIPHKLQWLYRIIMVYRNIDYPRSVSFSEIKYNHL